MYYFISIVVSFFTFLSLHFFIFFVLAIFSLIRNICTPTEKFGTKKNALIKVWISRSKENNERIVVDQALATVTILADYIGKELSWRRVSTRRWWENKIIDKYIKTKVKAQCWKQPRRPRYQRYFHCSKLSENNNLLPIVKSHVFHCSTIPAFP